MECAPAIIYSTVWLPVLVGVAALFANIFRFCKLIRSSNTLWRVALAQCFICVYIVGVYIFLAIGGFGDGDEIDRLFFRAAMMMATVGILTEALADL